MPVEEEKPPIADREPEFLADMRQLLDDSRALLSSEMAFHKARMRFTGRAGKWAAIWFALGLGFIVSATIVLSLGGLLVLAPMIGPLAAMLVMTVGCLVAAVAAILLSRGKMREVKQYFAISGEASQDDAEGDAT